MPRTLSSTATASINAQETSEIWLALITLSHPDVETPLRFVNNNEIIMSGGEIFLPFPFELIFPDQTDESPGEARIVIDNIDRSIVNFIRSIFGPPKVTIQVVLASSPGTIEAEFADMSLRNVTYDKKTVSGVLKFDDIVIEPVTVEMTPQRFPGQF